MNHANKGLIENENKVKNLLTFVKSPGLKTAIIKIKKEDLEFFPIDISQCQIVNRLENKIKGYNFEKLEKRMEHKLCCEIRSLFDENKVLPIEHAHIAVEIYVE